MSNHGFIRVAAASPIMKVADSEFNIREIIKLINKANSNYASVLPDIPVVICSARGCCWIKPRNASVSFYIKPEIQMW
jgi:hypothetical protein